MNTTPSAPQHPWRDGLSANVTSECPTLSETDGALLDLGEELKAAGYRFTTVTPASHARVRSRESQGPRSLTDIFGWNRSFTSADLSRGTLALMMEAGILDNSGHDLKSRVRFSTLDEQLFVHTSYPTDQSDAVFFGPDTYRFARLIRDSLRSWKRQNTGDKLSILDIGVGTGAGGLHAASHSKAPAAITLTDINQRALQFCKINSELNRVKDVRFLESNLYAKTEGYYDLILANPPYLVDPTARVYRHGGGQFGFELSLLIAEQGLSRLASGGRLVLYTGSAIIDGVDPFYEALSSKLATRAVHLTYEEIDPDVFGEELENPPYDIADRIAVVAAVIDHN